MLLLCCVLKLGNMKEKGAGSAGNNGGDGLCPLLYTCGGFATSQMKSNLHSSRGTIWGAGLVP